MDALVDVHDLLGGLRVFALHACQLRDFLLRRDLPHVPPVLDALELAAVGLLLRALGFPRRLLGRPRGVLRVAPAASSAAASPAAADRLSAARLDARLPQKRQQHVHRRNRRIDGAERLRVVRGDLRLRNRNDLRAQGVQRGEQPLHRQHAALHGAVHPGFQPREAAHHAVDVPVRDAHLPGERLHLAGQIVPRAACALDLRRQLLPMGHLLPERLRALQGARERRRLLLHGGQLRLPRAAELRKARAQRFHRRLRILRRHPHGDDQLLHRHPPSPPIVRNAITSVVSSCGCAPCMSPHARSTTGSSSG